MEFADEDAATINQARLTVAYHATDVEEATEFMKMLGIHPSQSADPAYSSKTMAAFGGAHQISANPGINPRPTITMASLENAAAFTRPITITPPKGY